MRPTPLDLQLLRSQSFAASILAAEIIPRIVDELLAAEHFAEDLDQFTGFTDGEDENLIATVDDEVKAAQIVLNRVALMFENMGICA